MKLEIRDRWIEALRSGRFRQGQGQLKILEEGTGGTKDKYCCLGVLRDILETNEEDECSSLSGPTLEMVGLLPEETDILIEMNDGEERSFLEIADYIETNL